MLERYFSSLPADIFVYRHFFPLLFFDEFKFDFDEFKRNMIHLNKENNNQRFIFQQFR